MLGIVKGPYLQWPSRDSMTIMWETSCEASSKVTYFKTKRATTRVKTIRESERTVGDPSLCRIHTVTLTGLKPDTTYHYKVSSANSQGEVGESEEYPLKTAVEEDEPFSFAVTSETGGIGDDEINRRLFSRISRYRPEFLLLVGDCVKAGRFYDQWERYLFAPGKELFTNTPFYLCLGNHEQNSPWFYKFVAYPEPKNYYSFDYGNAHFVALDGKLKGKGYAPGSPQYKFLVDDLKATQATWKFAFFHYPPYVSGNWQVEEMRVLCPVFEEYGVDIVFNSHNVVYERSHPIRGGKVDLESGVIYIVAGGAGAKPDWFHHKRAWHTAQALAVPRFVQVIIAGDMLELRAIDYEGRLFDTMVLTKRRHFWKGVQP